MKEESEHQAEDPSIVKYKSAGPGYHIMDLVNAAENEMTKNMGSYLTNHRNVSLGHVVTFCTVQARYILGKDPTSVTAKKFMDDIEKIHGRYYKDVDAIMDYKDQRERLNICELFLLEVGILKFPSDEEEWREDELLLREKERRA